MEEHFTGNLEPTSARSLLLRDVSWHTVLTNARLQRKANPELRYGGNDGCPIRDTPPRQSGIQLHLYYGHASATSDLPCTSTWYRLISQ